MRVVIADTGPIITLGIVDGIDIIKNVLGNFYIPVAVWEELKNYNNPDFDKKILTQLEDKVKSVKGKNYLISMMDYGESEAVLLYQELKADYFLVDDQRARNIAESMDINCIGSVGLLLRAKSKGYLQSLRPVFSKWIHNKRYFSLNLLNTILIREGEEPI
jgi:uncharacterized protein